ncbi:DUF4328 domain-containing protein [Promicromonospora thailandica]|uniref:DUF4328 domain-containing protein n=1 Tax=Promicromonospora thailandica TaxID=765201 RepID=A0A9X2JVA6_9MICO|nr:DUF4328 domain-containing protein [Promicromonospora thailandica]MCP2263883.1 protein of unknown function (DUF4328) [Promicromonospora thailandica]BFF17808.1 hypothetical protein GCM10025730_13290 [Promicromonospora thailandica]
MSLHPPAAAPPLTVPRGAGTVVTLACVVTGLQLVAFVVALASATRGDGVPSPAAVTLTDLPLALVQVAAGIVTCTWLWRSRQLAVAVDPGAPHVRDAVWVWLGWVVPVVAWWFPYQVVRDIREATVRDPADRGGLWWGAWLVTSWVSSVSVYGVAFVVGGVAGPALLPVLEGIVLVAMGLALWGWVEIVREIHVAQRQWVSSASATAPPA